jgi:hypothetical protein
MKIKENITQKKATTEGITIEEADSKMPASFVVDYQKA